MKFSTPKREQWIPRRKKAQASATRWAREYGFLALAVIVVVAILWYRGGFDAVKGIFVTAPPQGYLEIEGRLITWQVYPTAAIFTVTNPIGITRQYTFSIDKETRILRERGTPASIGYSHGTMGAIRPGTYLKVYLQKTIKEDPQSRASAVVYKE